jgi:hypothetical protein
VLNEIAASPAAAVPCKVCSSPAREVFRLPSSKLTGQPVPDSADDCASYDPGTCARDWWYLGPANGHVSRFTARAFGVLAKRLGARRRASWNNYPGLQAWQF